MEKLSLCRRPLLPGLSGSALKVIAVLSMITDHCAYYLMSHGTWLHDVMRCFGRIAFPVFAFLVAEGFAHTKDRMKYFLSLLCFAVVSELPWYLLNGNDGTHNVLFTLSLGVVALAVFEGMKSRLPLAGLAVLGIAGLSTWLGVDYEWRGVLMIVVFYLLHCKQGSNPHIDHRPLQLLCTFPLMMHYGMVGALLACFTLLLYNGQRGFIHGKVAKYGFYAFYPLHLFLLWMEL